MVQTTTQEKIDFEDPKPGEYMGQRGEESPVYAGFEDYQSNTLDPVFKPIEIEKLSDLCDGGDITRHILIGEDLSDHSRHCN
jgi:hypothetical protein